MLMSSELISGGIKESVNDGIILYYQIYFFINFN